uniref:RNA polymerase beta' subunit n=1 Tax=Helleborus foetidus TaxID=46996 RepID=UPI0025AA2B46|nr:RNA polymerase beta' subunit [Helleborus foetidus]WIW41406.1 RNA polymerase beta' subunit [Helleborus foetidus]
MNQNFSSMIERYKHQQLRIGLVSPQQIIAWAKKILPNGEMVGEVTKPYTFHYKTNKPEKDGLFCERIFGWRLDQRVISPREVPIEVQCESFGTYDEIYGHYLIVRNVKKEILSMDIRTTVGHISFYREIEEAVQGFCRACSYST